MKEINTIHVIPINDTAGHDESEDCLCKPHVKFVSNGKLVIHNSWDGREFFELKGTNYQT